MGQNSNGILEEQTFHLESESYAIIVPAAGLDNNPMARKSTARQLRGNGPLGLAEGGLDAGVDLGLGELSGDSDAVHDGALV